WLPAWCRDHLGGEPAGVLFRVRQVSLVLGLRLADGRDVVVKARAGEGRTGSGVAARARLAGDDGGSCRAVALDRGGAGCPGGRGPGKAESACPGWAVQGPGVSRS